MRNISVRRRASACCVLVATLTILSISPQPATADPLRIDSGFVFLGHGPIQSFGLDFGLFGDGFAFLAEHGTERDYLIGFTPEHFQLVFSPSEAMESCRECSTYGGDFVFGTSGAPLPNGWAPFTMRGTLDEYRPGSAQAIRHELMGSGRMTGSAAASVLYQFESAAAPVPEPATLILLGSGLLTAVHAARRRRRQS